MTYLLQYATAVSQETYATLSNMGLTFGSFTESPSLRRRLASV